MNTQRRIALLAALWVVLYLMFLTGRRMIPFDSVEFFYPSAYFSATGFRHGDWPWWNPLIYAGFPQVADPQGLMFSPILMPLMVAVDQPGVAWFDIAVVVHLLLGGIGVLLLCSAFRFGAAAALLAAVVYMVGGPASARLQHTTSILAYAYLPWVILCCERFAERAGWRWAIGLGVAAGALLNHIGQPTYLFALFAIAYLAVRLHAAGTMSLPSAARAAVAGAVALLIAGLQVAATLTVLSLSTRGPFGFAEVAASSLTPQAFLTLVWPNAFGSLDGPYTGLSDATESFLYFGVIGVCVLLAGLRRALGDPSLRAVKLFLLCALVLSACYMLGANTPLYRVLYDVVPGVSMFRRPSDAAFVFNFCAALLAGFSASALADDPARRDRVGIGILAVAAAWLLTVAALEAWRGNGHKWIFALAAVAASMALLAWRAPANRKPMAIAIGIGVVCFGDLRIFNVPTQLNAHGMGPVAALRAPEPAIRTMLDDPAMVGAAIPMRVEPTLAGEFASTALVVHRIYSTQGYNPLRIAHFHETFGAQETGNSPRPLTPSLPSRDSPLFDVGGTRYVLTRSRDESSMLSQSPGKFERVVSDGGVELWRNNAAYERVLTPRKARVLPAGARPEAAHFQNVDFRRELLLYPASAQDEALARDVSAKCSGQVRIRGLEYRNSRLRIDASAAEPGWIAVSDVEFPGWRATANGAPLRIWRANGPFRAVCAPAGDTTVEMRFDPLSLLMDSRWLKAIRD